MKKTIRLTLDQELLDAIDARAKEDGITRSELILAACLRKVQSPTKKQIEEWGRKDAEIYSQIVEEWDPDEWKDYWPKTSESEPEQEAS